MLATGTVNRGSDRPQLSSMLLKTPVAGSQALSWPALTSATLSRCCARPLCGITPFLSDGARAVPGSVRARCDVVAVLSEVLEPTSAEDGVLKDSRSFFGRVAVTMTPLSGGRGSLTNSQRHHLINCFTVG